MGVFPSVSPPPLRAFHASELPILFDNVEDEYSFTNPPTELENAATKYMEKAWAVFITDPANGLKSLAWPLYRGASGEKTLVELFPDNNVEHPILLKYPLKFDAGCAA
jgi:carboxylesterase type B